MTPRALVAAGLAFALGSGAAPIASGQPSAEWREFAGSWSLSGRRHAITQQAGTATVVDLSGAIVLAAGAALGRGFRGEVVGFDDGEGMSVGRAVWTDERGDRVFSRLAGEAIRGGRRITGTITGGTGRYAGIEGEYAFTWQYVLADEDGRIQGRAGDLKGRARRGTATP
jgi:hypothetical protein